MKKQQILFGVLSATLLGVTGYLAFRPRASLPEAPLASVPDTAVLVAHADVASLIRTPVFRQLTQSSGDESIARLRSMCGFNPLEAIREATLFVSEGGNLSPEHIGVILRGRVGAGDLGACLRRAVENDGGAVRNAQIEGFPAVVSTGGGSRAVFVGDDGFVEGAEAPVLAALHAANGSGGSALRHAELNELWEKLGRDRDISVLSRVPASWNEPLRALAERQHLPALAELRALGVGVSVSQGVAASAIIRMSAPAHAQAITAAILAYKAELLRTPFLSFTPFGAALASVRVEAQASEVVLAADLTAEQVTALIGLIANGAPPGLLPSGPTPPPSTVPPQVIPPSAPSGIAPPAAAPSTPPVEAPEVVRRRVQRPAAPVPPPHPPAES